MYQIFILILSLFIALFEVKFGLYFGIIKSNNSMRNFGNFILCTLFTYIASNIITKILDK